MRRGAAWRTGPTNWATTIGRVVTGNVYIELKRLLSLAMPMVLTQVSQMGMGVIDTIMAGRVSAADLAGVALGGNFFWPLMLLLSGTIMSLTPTVSQLHGARRQAEVGEVVRQALYIVVVGGGALVVFLNSYFKTDVSKAFLSAYGGHLERLEVPVRIFAEGIYDTRYRNSIVDGHANPAAHRLIADALYRALPIPGHGS